MGIVSLMWERLAVRPRSNMVDEVIDAVIISEDVDFSTPGGEARKGRRWAL